VDVEQEFLEMCLDSPILTGRLADSTKGHKQWRAGFSEVKLARKDIDNRLGNVELPPGFGQSRPGGDVAGRSSFSLLPLPALAKIGAESVLATPSLVVVVGV
jgi:hypothetical protein